MSSFLFIVYSSAKSRMAKYSLPTTKPTSPWRASRPILLQKVSELGKVPGVFDVGRCRIAMHDDRLILHQCTTSFVVAPDALCFRVGRCAPEDTAEHLQGCVDPARLVNGCHPSRSTLGTNKTTRTRFSPPLRTGRRRAVLGRLFGTV